MKSNLTINGKNALTTWGVTLADGSVTALMTPGSSKPLVTNVSRLQNGKRVIRKDSKANSLKRVSDRDVLLIFNMYASDYEDLEKKQNGLIAELMKGETEIRIPQLPSTYFRMDYQSCTEFSQLRGRMAKYIFKFNEPDPTDRSQFRQLEMDNSQIGEEKDPVISDKTNR